MLVKNMKGILLGSGLLLGMALPVFAAQETSDYGVDIYFSNNYDAKRMVQSAYTTLAEMNGTLELLTRYTINTLSTGRFNDDELFQKKKYNLLKNLNNHKLNLSLFGGQSLFINQRGEQGGFINIPAMEFKQLGLNDTDLLSAEHAKHAEKALQQGSKTLMELISPIYIFKAKNKPARAELNNLNTLRIKDPKSFSVISNSLEQAFRRYNKELLKLTQLASKATNGHLSSRELEQLNMEYQSMLTRLESLFNGGSMIAVSNVFKDIELTLRYDYEQQKTYYFPELSLSTLQLENDNLIEATEAIKTYIDLLIASEWVLDWTINGQQIFIPVNERHENPVVPAYLLKSNTNQM